MIEGANQSVYQYPVYMLGSDTVLWTLVRSLARSVVHSVEELHELEREHG